MRISEWAVGGLVAIIVFAVLAGGLGAPVLPAALFSAVVAALAVWAAGSTGRRRMQPVWVRSEYRRRR